MNGRNAGAVIIILLLIYLTITAIRSGVSYVAQYRVHSSIDQWLEQGTAPSIEAWEALLDTVVEDRSYPDAINAVGRLYDFRSSAMASNSAERVEFGNRAIAHYLRVTQLRPAWPYGWMNMAMMKARMGKIDEQFRHALLQLLKLGPWEHNTLPEIIRLSLIAWPYLKPGERKPLLDYFSVAQEQRKGNVQKTVSDSEQLQLYCAIMTHAESKASFCP